MNTDRRKALSGIMYGLKDFVPHKDLAVMIGDGPTEVYNELREMEIDGIVERLAIPSRAFRRQQDQVAWRLKPSR